MHSHDEHSVHNLNNALAVVRERLSGLDIAEQCRHADAECRPLGSGAEVRIRYFNQDVVVSLPQAEIAPAAGAPDLPLREKVLVLHYLANATGAAPTGRLITYRDLPGGLVYFPTFSKRTTDPLTLRFGRDAALLRRVGQQTGSRGGDIGDVSLVIDVFPRVSVTLALWEGDDELPPRLNILFDASIMEYMEPEDVTIACEILTWRLIRSSR